MPTFAELKTQLERWIIDNNIQLTNESGDLVNKAHREIQNRHNFKAMETKTSATELVTTNITRTIASLPANWKEKRANPFIVDAAGNTDPIEWAPSEEEMVKLYDDNTTTDKGEPEFIYESFTGFDSYPYPDNQSDHGDGNYRITIPYWKYLDVLTADDDTDWITENLQWAVHSHALAWGFLLNEDEDRAAVWIQLAEQEIDRRMGQEKRKQVKRSGILTPRRDVNAPFNAKGWR